MDHTLQTLFQSGPQLTYMNFIYQNDIVVNAAISHSTTYCSGSDVVDWLYSHVEGFQDRREARKYACNLLKVVTFDAITDNSHA